MANTSKLNQITSYVVSEIGNLLNVELSSKQVRIGIRSNGEIREKKFDGVSNDNGIILNVVHNSGLTSGGSVPSGKINSVLAKCYYLSLTPAERKILVLTDREFFDIFWNKSDGILRDIEIQYFQLPPDLEEARKQVSQAASTEMA